MNQIYIKSLITAFSFFVFIAIACAEEIEKENVFKATLNKVTPITKFHGDALLTHFDPNYVITLKLNDGSLVYYAIHSPTKLLGSRYKLGDDFNFIVVYEPTKTIKNRIHVEDRK